jgi:hypothetical protein
MILPDPYDVDWPVCLAAYRFNRRVTMDRLYNICRELTLLEGRIDEIDERGGPTPDEDREIADRLRVQNILQNIERQQLIGLRYYLDLVRVVHKKADRAAYELVYRNARELGIPPYLTRKMLDASISRNN